VRFPTAACHHQLVSFLPPTVVSCAQAVVSFVVCRSPALTISKVLLSICSLLNEVRPRTAHATCIAISLARVYGGAHHIAHVSTSCVFFVSAEPG
jgi:hypothetical protein